jgi:hypothetical protein
MHDHEPDNHQKTRFTGQKSPKRKEIDSQIKAIVRKKDSARNFGALIDASFLTHPLVVLKTRAQLGFTSNFQALKEIGLSGALRGITPHLITFATRVSIQQLTIKPQGITKDSSNTSYYISLIAPFIFGWAVAVPAENIQTKMIHDSALNRSPTLSAGQIAMSSYRNRGISGLYRGFVPYTLSYGAFLGPYLYVAHKMRTETPTEFLFKVLPISLLLSIVTNPLEVVKTHFQSLDGEKSNFKQVYAKEGVSNLFTKGLLQYFGRNVVFSFIYVYFRYN